VVKNLDIISCVNWLISSGDIKPNTLLKVYELGMPVDISMYLDSQFSLYLAYITISSHVSALLKIAHIDMKSIFTSE
jgi:hypothetical protein